MSQTKIIDYDNVQLSPWVCIFFFLSLTNIEDFQAIRNYSLLWHLNEGDSKP